MVATYAGPAFAASVLDVVPVFGGPASAESVLLCVTPVFVGAVYDTQERHTCAGG